MFCSKCGKELPQGSNACPNCNEPVKKGFSSEEMADKLEDSFREGVAEVKKINTWGIARILFFVGGILTIISTFIPLASASVFGYSISNNMWLINVFGGIVTLVAGIVGLCAGMFNNRVVKYIATASILLMMIIWVAAVNSAIAETFGIIKVGPAFVLIIIAFIATAIALVVDIIIRHKENNKH